MPSFTAIEQETAPEDYYVTLALTSARNAMLAANPPAETTGRERSILLLVAFADVNERVANYLLDRVSGATDEALECPAYRERLCASIMDAVLPHTYTLQ